MDKIKFGTDGWRGLIADDFTFANVRRVGEAIAQYVHEESEPTHGLAIGYDMRFLSPEFARAAAEVISAAGIPVWLADKGTPTPAVSYAVVARKTAGAVMITASHNPTAGMESSSKRRMAARRIRQSSIALKPISTASTAPRLRRAKSNPPQSKWLT